MPKNIDQKLALATRITDLRIQLAAAEAAFMEDKEPTLSGRSAVSISQLVLGVVKDAGQSGVSRQELRQVISGQEGAVTAALKSHGTAGRIANVNGRWVSAPQKPELAATSH